MTKTQIQDTIRQLYVSTGRFPKIAELAVAFSMPQYKVTLMLQRFVQDGFLIRVGNWYRFPPVVTATEAELTEAPPVSSPDVSSALLSVPVTEPDPPAPEPELLRFLPVLRWTFLVIGVVASLLAAWYTELWFAEYLPVWVAWLTAGIFVAFTVMAFELSLFLFVQAMENRGAWLSGIKWGALLLGVFIFVLWVVVLGVSIGARVAGQYNQWVGEQVASPVDPAEIARKTELDQIPNQRQSDKDNIARWQPLLDTAAALVQKSGADLETKQTWGKTYAAAQSDVALYTKRILQAQEDIKALNARELELQKATPPVQSAKDMDDAYTWAGRALGIPKGQVQFWANVLPAVFLDVIAPVGVTVFLFVGGRKRKL